jgi:hypothetical protein
MNLFEMDDGVGPLVSRVSRVVGLVPGARLVSA